MQNVWCLTFKRNLGFPLKFVIRLLFHHNRVSHWLLFWSHCIICVKNCSLLLLYSDVEFLIYLWIFFCGLLKSCSYIYAYMYTKMLECFYIFIYFYILYIYFIFFIFLTVVTTTILFIIGWWWDDRQKRPEKVLFST